jgi:hypothetical protein
LTHRTPTARLIRASVACEGVEQDASGALLTRALAAILTLGLVTAGCSASPDTTAPSGPASGSASSLTVPLAAADPEAFRAAEAGLRREGREQAGLSKLGPGAMELATFMDRTVSFLLVQLPDKIRARAGSVGRLAAPLVGLPDPGAPVFGTYLMTTVLFDSLIADRPTTLAGTPDPNEKCPCTKSATFDPTKDEVTVGGHKGTISTTISMSATVSGSKVSLDIKMKVDGEVRDAATGALLYKISTEATGHAEGDACPDASGVAHASMTFGGGEDYFNASGTKTGTKVSEGFGGQIRMRVDDNAKLSGVDLSTTGRGADFMIRLAAQTAAPAFEKAWRSGMCIAVLVAPLGGDVEPDSVTNVTAKVKHKIEGSELDKPVEAKMASGVKSIDPAGSKVKAPATFKYTAGSQSGDQGGVSFESVSNRGIGHAGVTYTVGGGWTISSTGSATETYVSGITNTLRVLIKDLKVTAAKGGALTGSGTLTLSGDSTGVLGPARCTGKIDELTVLFNARGTLVGTGPGAVLRLTLETPNSPNSLVALTCAVPGGGTVPFPASPQAHVGFYRQAVGEFDLPADGGTKTTTGTVAFTGLSVAASATFTVVKAKK